jgi:cytochrome c
MMRTLPWVVPALVLLAPNAQANEELMRRGGCVGCHDVDEKLIGPAYRDVANRYRGQPKALEQLFKKVREGGTGNWGDASMTPNGKDKISDDDLRQLLHWILSL